MTEEFEALKPEYTQLLATVKIDRDIDHPGRTLRILELAKNQDWAAVTAATGVPKIWGLASFEREASSDYTLSPAQGDRWDRVSIHVPRGLGPYRSWAEACIAAYRIDHLDAVGAGNWTWERMLFEAELYNGFGPRARGFRSGYLWAGTNHYTTGKYVADGIWDPKARDTQIGMVALMVMLVALEPSLLPGPLPAWTAGPIPPVAPAPPALDGSDLGSVGTLQSVLNRLGADPRLTVDGSYGRETRRAVAWFQAHAGLAPDGIAGPWTTAALSAALEKLAAPRTVKGM